MTINFKACPRCTGDVETRVTDITLDDSFCIQCGHRLVTIVERLDILGEEPKDIKDFNPLLPITKASEPRLKPSRTKSKTVTFTPISIPPFQFDNL